MKGCRKIIIWRDERQEEIRREKEHLLRRLMGSEEGDGKEEALIIVGI